MNQEITQFELLKVLSTHWRKIFIAIILGTILSVIFMMVFVEDEYQSEAQLIVNQQTNKGAIQAGEIQANVQLIDTYRDIILGQSVLEAVNANLENNYEMGELREKIEVNQTGNSQAFYITATMSSPEEAQIVVNSVIKSFEDMLNQIYGNEVTGIFVLFSASYNKNRTAPNLSTFLLIGSALGLTLSIAIILVKGMFDKKLKDADLLKTMGLIQLGDIYIT